MERDAEKLSRAFRRVFADHQLAADEEVVPIVAAILDIADQSREIYEEFLPPFESMSGNGSFSIGELLDLLVKLRVAFFHLQYHVDTALESFDSLIIKLGERERRTH